MSAREILEKLELYHAELIDQSAVGFYCKCRYNHMFLISAADTANKWCPKCETDQTRSKLIKETNIELKTLKNPLQLYELDKYGIANIICPNNHIINCDIDEIPDACPTCDIENADTSAHDTEMWHSSYQTDTPGDPAQSGRYSPGYRIRDDSDTYSINSDMAYAEASADNSDNSDGFDFDTFNSMRIDTDTEDKDETNQDDDVYSLSAYTPNAMWKDPGFNSRFSTMFNHERFRGNREFPEQPKRPPVKPNESEFETTACAKLTDDEFVKLTTATPKRLSNNLASIIAAPTKATIAQQISHITPNTQRIFTIRNAAGKIYTAIYCIATELEQNIIAATNTQNIYYNKTTDTNELYIDYSCYHDDMNELKKEMQKDENLESAELDEVAFELI